MRFAIGSDPELFGVLADGTVIPSEKFIPEDNSGLVVRDGVQVEIHPTPAMNADEFVANTQEALNEAESYASAFNITLSHNELVEVDTSTLSQYANTFGCKPSYNAYGDEVRPPSNAKSVKYRSAGGHIHIGGIDDDAFNLLRHDSDMVVKILDITVGVYSVLKENSTDGARRRKYYGRAGDYRLPPHGLEYRVPSNFWIWDADGIKYMHEAVMWGLGWAQKPKTCTYLLDEIKKAGFDIQQIINTSNKLEAQKLLAFMHNLPEIEA